jgi:predicted DNA binding CopG/RHH family protein
LGLGTGEKGENFMKKKTKNDQNKPIGTLRVISDFLPPPDELLPADETVKVTILLDKNSVHFFKKKAEEAGIKYQRMMRQVLKGYAEHYA